MSTFGTCDKCGADLVSACPECGKPVEVYSRICGYLRPLENWNDGKRAEFADRKTYLVSTGDHQDWWDRGEITDAR